VRGRGGRRNGLRRHPRGRRGRAGGREGAQSRWPLGEAEAGSPVPLGWAVGGGVRSRGDSPIRLCAFPLVV
jgi:hypothetical protein